ncbi:methyltransferase [Paraflavitalea speifideaquila]|uniref:methyltransferase n=1 Tax=Paraflavitalea speifideaquila TaxID=3076558 RepID=UPI0028E5A7AF|nr:methyltransferase [Paraflavitalea speifideiaquila]
MLQVLEYHWYSCCVFVAAKLNISDHLYNGPRSVEALASATGTHAPSLYRVLRALASKGIFEEIGTAVFSLTPDATALLSDAPGTMKHFILAEHGELYNPWGQLLHTVQTGGTAFDQYYKMDLWQYYATNEEAGVNFMQAMTRLTQYSEKAIVEAYDFSRLNTLVDIGGGNGGLLMSIAKSAPQLKGIVFDAPYVAEKQSWLLKRME